MVTAHLEVPVDDVVEVAVLDPRDDLVEEAARLVGLQLRNESANERNNQPLSARTARLLQCSRTRPFDTM